MIAKYIISRNELKQDRTVAKGKKAFENSTRFKNGIRTPI